MMRFLPFGDLALRAELPAGADRRALLARLRAAPGVIDAVVTETHAMLVYPAPQAVPTAITLPELSTLDLAPRREWIIEAVYDGDDLPDVARSTGLSIDEVIDRHASATYEVSFVGFLPGFAYLRGLDRALASVPRRDNPRPRVPAGAIGLAGGFTGVYPCASAGGWHLVGRALERPTDLAIGDRVRFRRR